MGDNNRIILISEDKTETLVSEVKGLEIIFHGSNNECRIHQGSGVFDVGSNICFYGNHAVAEIGKIYVHASITVLMGENARLYIGNDFSSNGTNFNLTETASNIHIGNNVLFARNTKVYSSDMHTIYDTKTHKVLNAKNKIRMENNIWICEDVMILGNSEIGSNSVIAARSLVNSQFSISGCILAGTPAEIVKTGISWSRSYPSEYMAQQNFLKENEMTIKTGDNENIRPYVSVLMPVYKTNPMYLKEAIESILAQTFRDFEFLILDDCPQDKNCEEIISRYKDKRIKYMRNEQNLGISASRNKLVDMAKGKYLAIMDHDDISLPERFEKEINFLDANPEYGVCGCQHTLMSDNSIVKRPLTDDEIKKMLSTSLCCPLHHPCTMIRRSVLTDNNIRYEEIFTPAEDYSLWLRLAGVTKLYNLPEVLFYYRNFNNTTSENLEKIQMRCVAAQMLINQKSYKLKKNKKHKKLFGFKTEYSPGRKTYKLTLFNKTIKLKTKLKLCKPSFQQCIYASKVPLEYNRDFYYFRKLPAFSENYALQSDRYFSAKTAVIMQGPLYTDYDFTYETLLIYMKTFLSNNANVVIILSTWNTENAGQIAKIKKLGVDVVLSAPVAGGAANINKQVITTKNGLQRAKELGCKYVLKTRTDQRLYAPNIIEFLFNVSRQFPLDTDVTELKERLIALSFNSFKNRLYGVSDMFLFGRIEDVMRYWDIPEDAYTPDTNGKSRFDIFKSECVETFICRRFLESLNIKTSDNIADTYKAYAKYFCFIDKETVEMYWPKYSNLNSRWESFENPALEEIKFRDWLNLYIRQGQNDDWSSPKPFIMPKI